MSLIHPNLYVSRKYTLDKTDWLIKMDNPQTQATLSIIHLAKTNNTTHEVINMILDILCNSKYTT